MFVDLMVLKIEEQDVFEDDETGELKFKDIDINECGFKMISIRPELIERFQPSVYSEEYTDLYLSDGDILVVAKDYDEFKITFYAAIKYLPEQTFKPTKSKDGEINIRCWNN